MYSTKYIAQSFVKQYYEILSAKPDELYKFYFSQASFLHTEATVVEDSVIGVEAIRNKVKGLNLLGAKIDISKGFVDFQEFDVNRVLVVVVGVFTAAGQSPRQFTQTFVLAGQNNNYFVSNSVFRVLAEEVDKAEAPVCVAAEPSPAVEVLPVSVVATPEPELEVAEAEEPVVEEVVVEEVPEVAEEVEAVQQPVAVVVEEEEVVPVVETVAAVEAEATPVSVSVPVSVEEEVVTSPATEEVEEEVEASNGAPKSYLDIVKKTAAKGPAPKETVATNGFRTFKAKTVATPQPTANSPAPAPTEHTPSSSPVVVSSTTVENKYKYTPSYHDIHKATGQQLYSVYVSNLPESITEIQLQQAFTSFGTVVQVDITRGKKYAFVKFDQIVAMQAALDHEVPIEVNGAILRVEERTKSTGAGGGNNHNNKDSIGKDKKPYRNDRKFVKDGKEFDFKDKKNNNNKDNNNNNTNNNKPDFKHKFNNNNNTSNNNKEYKKETKSSEVETSK